MKLSAKVEYAIKAVYELARQSSSYRPVTVEHIASKQFIPQQFLVQVLTALSHAGIVRSVRGTGGGYFLGRQPSQVTVLDVFRALDKGIFERYAGARRRSPSSSEAVLNIVMEDVDNSIFSALNVSFEKLLSYGESTVIDYQI